MNKEEQIKILNSVLYRPWIEISDNERETIETLFNNLQFELDKANKKLEDLKDYINYLVILSPGVGRFNKTIWGKEILEIIGGE